MGNGEIRTIVSCSFTPHSPLPIPHLVGFYRFAVSVNCGLYTVTGNPVGSPSAPIEYQMNCNRYVPGSNRLLKLPDASLTNTSSCGPIFTGMVGDRNGHRAILTHPFASCFCKVRIVQLDW